MPRNIEGGPRPEDEALPPQEEQKADEFHIKSHSRPGSPGSKIRGEAQKNAETLEIQEKVKQFGEEAEKMREKAEKAEKAEVKRTKERDKNSRKHGHSHGSGGYKNL